METPFKLEKLTISKLTDKGKQLFEVMFNPESFSSSYGHKIRVSTGVGVGKSTSMSVGQMPEQLDLHLIFDGTGAADFGLPVGLGKEHRTVKEQVDEFLTLCYKYDGEKHAANQIKIKWGIIDFKAWLKSVDINYKSFDRTGQPLRAELDVTFVQTDPDKDPTTATSSPDLTHSRIVKAGDTLPLLTKEIYGSSKHYLFVATANKLNNFRKLEPGQKLNFPPLEK